MTRIKKADTIPLYHSLINRCLFFNHLKFNSAVLGAVFPGIVGNYRFGFAEPFYLYGFGTNAIVDQIIANRLGPSFRKTQIILFRTNRIGMPSYFHHFNSLAGEVAY